MLLVQGWILYRRIVQLITSFSYHKWFLRRNWARKFIFSVFWWVLLQWISKSRIFRSFSSIEIYKISGEQICNGISKLVNWGHVPFSKPFLMMFFQAKKNQIWFSTTCALSVLTSGTTNVMILTHDQFVVEEVNPGSTCCRKSNLIFLAWKNIIRNDFENGTCPRLTSLDIPLQICSQWTSQQIHGFLTKPEYRIWKCWTR